MPTATAKIRVHVALIEWDSSEEPDIHYGLTYGEVARKAIERCRQYTADDDPDFWEGDGRDVNVNHLDEQQLVNLHADFREAVTVPWVTFSEQEIEGWLI